MNVVLQPNQYSCAIAATAAALNRTFDEVLKAVGHDGSAILFPGLSEPARRAAIYDEDINVAALRLGFVTMKIAVNPCYPDKDKTKIPKYSQVSSWFLFLTEEWKLPVTLTVESERYPGLLHCVAYNPLTPDVFMDPQEGFRPTDELTPISYIDLFYPINVKLHV